MRRLYSAANLTDAYLLLHRLTQADIPARVLNEHAQGGLGEIPFTHAGPEIWIVRDADFDRARAIVSEYESMRPSKEGRRCLGCGEENPAEFELCWRCQRALT